MKKILLKLKKNRLVSKITVFSVILMILVSSFTVSSFAADDEVSASSDEVNSITDTWTAIFDWITRSLGSVQNVFYSSGSSFTILPDQWVLDNSEVVDVWFASFDFDFDVSLLQDLDSIDLFISVGGESFTIPFSVSFSDYVCELESDFFNIYYIFEYEAVGLDSPWLFYSDSLPSYPLVVEFPFGSGLTFLGTLSVVGVSIALILLLISVVINFLRLRG